MDDLARRALIGDTKAQNECAEKGIVLSCPFCGKAVKVSVSKMLYACSNCHITVAFNSFHVNPEDTLKIWNMRLAPPIDRCEDCRYCDKREDQQGVYWCDLTGSSVMPDDFCSYFE